MGKLCREGGQVLVVDHQRVSFVFHASAEDVPADVRGKHDHQRVGHDGGDQRGPGKREADHDDVSQGVVRVLEVVEKRLK